MKGRVALLLCLGLQSAVACIVPTFDVDSTAQGGTAQTGGGQGGTHEQAGSASGGKAQGGKATSSGGAQAGTPPAGGETAAAGDGAGGANPGGPTGPVRVGFSVFHDSASGSEHAASKLADASFKKPADTQPGDFMLVFFGCDHNLQNMADVELAKTGWILHDQHEDKGEDGQGTYLAYKIVDGTEPDPIVFKGINPAGEGNGNGVQGLLSVYRGVDPFAPINAYAIVLDETGFPDQPKVVTRTPPVTTTVDNCLLIAGLSPDTQIDAPVISSWPAGFDENQVSVMNPANPYPNGWANIYSAERHLAKAGTVAESSFTWDLTYGGTLSYGALSFVLGLAPLAK